MISKEAIRKTADLAKLEFSESELDSFQDKFQKIVDYVGKIDLLDLKDVAPMTHIHDFTANIREDVSIDGLPVEVALGNAPKKSDTYFKVPKVIEGEE